MNNGTLSSLEMTVSQLSTQLSSATGVVKKIFPLKREPYGFLKLLTPLEKRGLEAAFFYTDIQMPQSELEYIQPGLTMKFKIMAKPEDHMMSPVPFKAVEIIPMDEVEQHGCVVRGPRENGKGIIVALDYCPTNVHISAASWSELCASEPKYVPLLPGDNVLVRSTWKEMLQAAKERRSPLGELVARLQTLPSVVRGRTLGSKRRSSSVHVVEAKVDNEETGTSEVTETTAATTTPSEASAAGSKQYDDNPTQLNEKAERNDEKPAAMMQGEEEASSAQQQQQQTETVASVELPPKEISCPIDYHDTIPYQDIPALKQRGRSHHSDAPVGRRRTRSCGSSLEHQAMLNQVLFAEELVLPLHASSGGDRNHASSHRISSPLLHEQSCANQCPSHYPTNAFLPFDNGCGLPTLAQAGMWSHWSQTAFRGQHSPFPGRMTLNDYIMNGGRL